MKRARALGALRGSARVRVLGRSSRSHVELEISCGALDLTRSSGSHAELSISRVRREAACAATCVRLRRGHGRSWKSVEGWEIWGDARSTPEGARTQLEEHCYAPLECRPTALEVVLGGPPLRLAGEQVAGRRCEKAWRRRGEGVEKAWRCGEKAWRCVEMRGDHLAGEQVAEGLLVRVEDLHGGARGRR